MKPFLKERLLFFIKSILSKKWINSTLTKVIIITFFCSLSTILINLFPLFEKLELLSLDLRYKIRDDIKKSEHIVLVNFDDASLNLYGQWPWSRFYQTLLVDTLSYYKVASIGYDVFFSEEERPILRQSEKNKSFLLRNHDDDFQRAISQSGVVYLAYSSRDPHTGLSKDEIAQQIAQLKKQFSANKIQSLAYMESSLVKASTELEPFLYKSIDIDPPIYKLLKSAKGFGFAQPGYSKDSTIRNFILFRYYDGLLLNPITLIMFSDWAGFELNSAEIKAGQNVVLKGVKQRDKSIQKDMVIPVDNNLQTLINWPGTFDSSFIHISFKDIVYLYSFNEATKIVNKTKLNSLNEYKEAIINGLSGDYLLPIKEIEQLAHRVALSKIISNMIMKGSKEEDIIKELQNFASIKDLQSLINELRAVSVNNKYGSGDDFSQNIITPKIPARINGQDVMMSPLSLKGKLVLVGLTGKNTIDLNPTPYEKDCPMVFYHASGLNMMLTGQFLHYPPKGLSEIMIVISVLSITFVGVYRSVSFLTIFSTIIAFIFTFFTYKMWVDSGQWIEYVPVISAMTFTYLIVLIMQFVKVYGEKSKIRAIFASMVSPAVLTVMENNPDKFALTGERRFATTYFSKIDAIDTIASSFSADQLPTFLSTYLTPMSDVIIEYNGYIDKYEGAVIMADFGVPLEDSENPIKCAFASLEQRFFIESFKFAINSRYNIRPTVSIGFNAGYVSAGNMGSDRKFQYTVMGDPVNMAARLMAANSIYDSTYAITSQETVNLIKDYVYARPLDKILLKGKTIPTMIYDIIGWRQESYREIMKGRVMPSYVNSFWTYAQVESIFYLHQFWSRQYERLDNSLARDISMFFKSCESIAKEVISLEVSFETIRICDEIEKRFNHKVLPDSIDSLTSFFDDFNKEQLHQDDISSLQKRVKLLSIRKNNILDTTLPALDKDLKSISSLLNNKYKEYHNHCNAFIKTIKPLDYFNLMSMVGEPENKELVTIFEQGLNAYWRRDWQLSSDIFKKGLAMYKDDNPLKAMVERIDQYKTNPPGINWQGEYIQTKK